MNEMNCETFALPEGASMPMIEIPGTGLMFGKYLVTQAQWRAVMGENPSHFKGDDLPVESVSWHDCQEFCKKLSTYTGREFRLPTSAEWETAQAGQVVSSAAGWFRENSEERTHPVGLKEPNAFGLYDMQGNVWEWCEDGEGDYKFLRGGSWSYGRRRARSVCRNLTLPARCSIYVGCRVVCVDEAARDDWRDEAARDGSHSLAAIVEQLAGCDYQCEAGPLVLNSAFLELRTMSQEEFPRLWSAHAQYHAPRPIGPLGLDEAEAGMIVATIRYHVAYAVAGNDSWMRRHQIQFELERLKRLIAPEEFTPILAEVETALGGGK